MASSSTGGFAAAWRHPVRRRLQPGVWIWWKAVRRPHGRRCHSACAALGAVGERAPRGVRRGGHRHGRVQARRPPVPPRKKAPRGGSGTVGWQRLRREYPLVNAAATDCVQEPVAAATATDSVQKPPQKISPLLKLKKLSDKAVLPSRGSAFAAGYDLSSAVETVVPARGKALVPTDLSIVIPHGTYARIAPRSGLALKHSIDVGAGVIDADYRGPVGVVLFNHSDTEFVVKPGDRIARIGKNSWCPSPTILRLVVRGAGLLKRGAGSRQIQIFRGCGHSISDSLRVSSKTANNLFCTAINTITILAQQAYSAWSPSCPKNTRITILAQQAYSAWSPS